MQFLITLVAFGAWLLTSTMAASVYNSNAGYGVPQAAPTGLLISQRILPSGNGYAAPAASGYGVAPAAIGGGYGVAPAAIGGGYGAGAGHGYGVNDAQVQSLARLALSLPTPAPDTSNHGRGYGSSHGSIPVYGGGAVAY